MKNKNNIFLAVLLGGIVFAGGFFVYKDFQDVDTKENGPVSGRAGEMAGASVISGTQEEPSEEAEIIGSSVNALLDRRVVVPSDIPSATAEAAATKIKDITNALRDNPNDAEAWLELGAYRKMIKDYDGARLIWEYVRSMRSEDGRPSNNLGNLYGYYLHDTKKAEAHYLEAISREPNQPYYYAALFEYYFDGLGDKAKAKAILEKGIAENPNNSQGLRNLLEKFF